MLKHRHADKICGAIIALTLVITIIFTLCAACGKIEQDNTIGYEDSLFDTSEVHTINIEMEDWEGFLDTCTSEEYSSCTVEIDGEKYGNVGIRGKGNTSLSSVASYGNDRYSFKIEFDHYQSDGGYYGLDKLSLNNIISDNTYLKDYLCYTMMNDMGVAAPLCSFVYITVNGVDWGLYLAVEGVEESFLQRNYGSDYGQLYKPDSMDMGGGVGNGKNFDFNDFNAEGASEDSGNTQERTSPPEGFDPSTMGEGGADMPQPPDASTMTDGVDQSAAVGDDSAEGKTDQTFQRAGRDGAIGGMGADDVKLQYIDDDPDSYPNIFDSAKTDISDEDKERLIESLKILSEGNDIESAVDVDQVIRYLVVHSFVNNEDSYTGSMIHNYYLYEEDGVLSMIPWDYNLAFSGMGMGGSGGGSGCTADINSPIDSPCSDIDSKPMMSWIFNSEEYTELYHQYYEQFMNEYFDSGYFTEMLDETIALISPYVEKDPTAFCTYDEFLTATDTLLEYCQLRAESVSGQLDGTIPSTSDEQAADSTALVDASQIDSSLMGKFSGGGGMNSNDQGDTMPDMREVPETDGTADISSDAGDASGNAEMGAMPEDSNLSESSEEADTSQMPADFDESQSSQDTDVFGDSEEVIVTSPQGEGFAPTQDGTSLVEAGTSGITQWIFLGTSVLVLMLGILIASRVKRF